MTTTHCSAIDTFWEEALAAADQGDDTGISLNRLSLKAYCCALLDHGITVPNWVKAADWALEYSRDEIQRQRQQDLEDKLTKLRELQS